MDHLYRMDIAVDREMFPKQPATIAVFFYLDPDYKYMRKEDENEISMDVCDSQYAILTIKQYYEFNRIFGRISQTDEAADQYMTLMMSWSIGPDQQFVMVVDEGTMTHEFEKYCDERDISCQFHIDQPSCQAEHYEYIDDDTGGELDPEACWANDKWIEENVYTGADYNRPHLIRTLHEIQKGK